MNAKSDNKPVQATAANFDTEVWSSTIPVVVDFWAPWCGPCRAIGPALEELAEKWAGRVKVAKVNVDDEPDLANAFQVRSIPTLVAIQSGKVVDVQIGFGGRSALEQLFAKATENAGNRPQIHAS